MISITCRTEELWEQQYEYFHHPHPRIQMKMTAARRTLLAQHLRPVATMLGDTETTIGTYWTACGDGGIDA